MESNGRMKMTPMEMDLEPMLGSPGKDQRGGKRTFNSTQPSSSSNAAIQFIHNLMALLRMYMDAYPGVVALIAVPLLLFVGYEGVSMLVRRPLEQHTLGQSFEDLDLNYNFKAARIDHWCLWGEDNACTCLDFTEPFHPNSPEWNAIHKRNVEERIQDVSYEVVFLGDEMVERLNGVQNNKPFNDGPRIRNYFHSKFSKEEAGDNFEGVALGIDGDMSAELLWRIQNGELPDSDVYWLWIGGNDLAIGGCSEEVTVLGILRVAEEIALRKPFSYVVVQGILPRSHRPDHKVSAVQQHHKIFGSARSHNKVYTVEQAKKKKLLWPSIQRINLELEKFCKNSKHSNIIYFDAASLFLHNHENEIIGTLLPDGVHLSKEGYERLGDAIVTELQRIKWDLSTDNEIVGVPE